MADKRYIQNNKYNQNSLLFIWKAMKARCFYKSQDSYKNYGGRGIIIENDWLNFKNFERDMKDTYKKGLSLDRIDNDGNYCKENCRWVTKKQQANNKRNNRFVELNGIVKTLSEWIYFYGLKSSTVRQRFYVYKWDIKDCLELNSNI